MKPSEILSGAARLLERETWSVGACYAIGVAAKWKSKYRAMPMLYLSLLARDESPSETDYWFGDPLTESQDQRILALCFAAAIAESEGQ